AVAGDDCRTIDLSVCRHAPGFLAGRAVNSIDPFVAAAGDHELVSRGDRGEIAELPLAALKAPSDFEFGEIDRDHLPAHRADIEFAVAHGRGRADLPAEIRRAELF